MIHYRNTALLLALNLTQIAASSFSGEVVEMKFFKPDAADMPAYTLPELLTTLDGRKVASADDWKNLRRPEVLELFRKNEYGRVPDAAVQTAFTVTNRDPNAMSGAATLKQIDVVVARGQKSLTIHVSLFIPNAPPKPVPVFLLICNRPAAENIDPTRAVKSPFWPAEEVVARGYGVAAFFNADVAPDKFDDFKTGAYTLFDEIPRAADSWSTIAAWAWGASRVMDYFETDKDIDPHKVAVVGHSRGGKTALWAGAQDERFALTISNDSGCSGAGLARRQVKEKETVAKINKAFPHWFCENYKSFGDKVDSMPMDQHMLIALMAPRAVYVASADKDLWADPRGEFLSVVNAGPVFQLFGKKGLPATEMPAIGEPIHGEATGYHIREGKHDLTVFDWKRYMDFADKVFKR